MSEVSELIAFTDALAQEIRRVDGWHSLGAGALAEALVPFIRANAFTPTDLTTASAEGFRGGARELPAASLGEVVEKLTEGNPEWRRLLRPNLRGDEAILYAIYDMASEHRALCAEVMTLRAPTPSTAGSGDAVFEYAHNDPSLNVESFNRSFAKPEAGEVGQFALDLIGTIATGIKAGASVQELVRTARAMLTAKAEGDGGEWPTGVLNRDRTIEVLRSHNEWRRGAEAPQTDPYLLGQALDAVLAALATTQAHP